MSGSAGIHLYCLINLEAHALYTWSSGPYKSLHNKEGEAMTDIVAQEYVCAATICLVLIEASDQVMTDLRCLIYLSASNVWMSVSVLN